jgi:transcriptional antiterminator Rof (Rho-off)
MQSGKGRGKSRTFNMVAEATTPLIGRWMPQESKSMPRDVESSEHAPGVEHEKLEGWIPTIGNDHDLCMALEKAFDYRGDITLTLKDGSKVEGYAFDRRSDGRTLEECVVRMFPKDRNEKVAIRYCDIAKLEFSGRDTAAGKSFETWLKKYQEKKAAGEKNIRIDPEALD